MYRWALETIAAVALDTRLGCLSPAPRPAHLAMIRAVQGVLAHSKTLDSGLRLWERLPLPSRDFAAFLDHYRTFKASARQCIEEAGEAGEAAAGPSLVSDLARSGCPRAVTSAAAVELLFGGVDTTSHTAIFLLYLLASNPGVQERLHAELAEDSLGGRDPARVLKLPYLRAVVREAMRMMPVAPANIRSILTQDNYLK